MMSAANQRFLRSGSIVVALMLAGALSASMFAIVDGLRHPRPPFSDSERVVAVSFRRVSGQVPGVQYLPEFAERRAELMRILSDPSLVQVAAQVSVGGFFDLGEAKLAHIESASVDSGFFALIGVPPIAGTPLLRSDEQWSQDASDGAPLPVVLGWNLAQRMFGDAQAALGTHELAGRRVSVRGVMPKGVKFPGETSVWAPPSQMKARVPGLLRLQPGVPLAAIAARVPELDLQPVTAQPDPSRANLPSLLLTGSLLLIVVALIQCAALLSAEMLERSTELRIRFALGGTWQQVARPVIARVALLCAGSTALAVLVTPVVTTWLVDALPQEVVHGQYFEPGFYVLKVGLLLAFTAFAILSAVPLMALSTLTKHGNDVGVREASAAPRLGGRFALLTAQVALTSALIYIAVVAWLGLMNFWQFDYGFKPNEVLSFHMPAPVLSGNSKTAFAEFKQLQLRLGQSIVDVGKLPGVMAAAGAFSAPIGVGITPEPEGITFMGRSREGLLVRANVVGSAFIRALGARIVAGRDPDEPDLRGQRGLIVINKTLARRLLPPGASELELHPLVGGAISSKWNNGRVVAIIDDLVQRSPEGRVEPEFYSVEGSPNAFSRVLIRTSAAALPAIQTVLEREWGPLRPYSLKWMTEELAPLAEPYASQARLLTLVMLGSIPLVVLGMFGAVSLLVRSREREIAIRMAIGAGRAEVRWLVVKRSVFASSIGWVAGVGIGVFVCRLASIRLFGVTTLDVTTLALSMLLITALTGLASSLPLWHASRIDPASLLRQSP